MRHAFIVDAVRTPRGRGKAGKGGLSSMHPQELLAQALNHLASRSGLRKEDVEDLFHAFLHRRCRSLRRATPVVRPEAIEALKSHAFPGNVSELKTLAELVASLAQEDVGLADLPIPVFVGDESGRKDLPLKSIVHAFERQVILRTLKAVRGNQSRAAERLDIHRNTLILKMQELDIPNKREQKKTRKKG